MLSVPPATTTRSMPARMFAAAVCTAAIPEAQWRLCGHPGHVGEAELDGDVAGDVAAALEHLAEHDVVEVLGRDPGALHRRLDRDAAEVERASRRERALPCRADRRCGQRRR